MASTLNDEREFAKILWYGREGTSKTTNMATLSARGKVCYVEAESGLKASPLRDLTARGILTVDTANIEPYRDIRYSSLDGLFWDLKSALDDDPNSYAGVNFDSLTEITKKILEQVVMSEVQKAEKTGKGNTDEFFVTQDYYRIMSEQVRRLVKKFRDLPCHVGFACLERRDTDEDSGTVQYGPALNPALQTDLLGYVDIVAHTFTDQDDDGEDIFVAHMRSSGKYRAKDRFHATPPLLVNPTFDRIIGYIEGSITRDNDAEQAAYRDLVMARREAKAKARAEAEAAKAAPRTTRRS